MSEENHLFDVIKQYLDTVVKPHFKITIPSCGFSEQGNNASGHYELPDGFEDYKNTDYYYKNTNKTFIHFTSFETFIHIINSGYFLALSLQIMTIP